MNNHNDPQDHYTPFGAPIHPDWYEVYEASEHATEIEREADQNLGGKLSDEDDQLFENLSRLINDPEEDPTEPQGTGSTSSSPAPGQKSQKRVRFLSGLARELIRSGNLLTTSSNSVFLYQAESGCFCSILDLAMYIVNTLPEETVDGLSLRDIHEIEGKILWNRRIRCSLDDFNSHPTLVNFENGVYDLEHEVLLPHDPAFKFSYQIRAKIEETDTISAPYFERFCETSLDGDPLKRKLLLEIIGYIYLDTNAGKCGLFLKGAPNSGKSVILSFVARLFDEDLVSSIPLHQLGDRFFRAELAGKKLNTAGEIAGRALRDISIFKSVTGGDRIVGEKKGEKPFYFHPRCKFLFSGNSFPLTRESDSTDAFINRIKVEIFNTSISPEDQDKDLSEKLWSERDAIVTLALKAAQELRARNFIFTEPADSAQFVKSLSLRGNIVRMFVDERCDQSPDARVFNVTLYAAFEDFCKKNGYDCPKKSKFYELLSGIPGVFARRIRIEHENRQGHIGIKLKGQENCGTLEQHPRTPARLRASGSRESRTNIIHERGDTMAKQKKQESIPLLLTPEQARKISGLGVNRIRQLMEDGQLEYLPVGNRRLMTVQALLDYYDRAKISVVAC